MGDEQGERNGQPGDERNREPNDERRRRWIARGLLAAAILAVALVGLNDWLQQRAISGLSRQVEVVAGRIQEVEEALRSLEALVSRQEQQEVTVYFTRLARPEGDDLEPVPVTRRVPRPLRAEEHLARAVEALLEGPTPEEQSRLGVHSEIPDGVRLLSARIENGRAVLDFSRELERTGGTLAVSGMLMQLAYTATGVPGVDRLELRVEGARVGTRENPFTGEGFLFDDLRRDYLPPEF